MDSASFCLQPYYIPLQSAYSGFAEHLQPVFAPTSIPLFTMVPTDSHHRTCLRPKTEGSNEAPMRRGRDFSEGLQAPYDMNTLKVAIQVAKPGTGEVRKVIEACTFRPRERAFTRLINMCGRQKEAAKALEVFEVMRYSRSVRPNTYTYSALISACSNAGDLDAAIDVYNRMKNAALSDPGCRPNQVTYNAVIAASERGGKYEVCLSCFLDMIDSDTIPDSAACCSAIFACQELGKWEEAERILSIMHSLNRIATVGVYSMMIEHYANESNWKSALHIFLEMQKAGQNVDARCCRGLMAAFEAGKQPLLAYELVESMWENDIHVEKHMYASVLHTLTSAAMWEDAIDILIKSNDHAQCISQESLRMLITSMKAAGEYKLAGQVEEILKRMDGDPFTDEASVNGTPSSVCSKYNPRDSLNESLCS